jgi:hypothetical protein
MCGGVSILPDGGSDLIDRADLIVVPGWKGADVPVPADLLEQVRAGYARGARLASICSGAFVLAATVPACLMARSRRRIGATRTPCAINSPGSRLTRRRSTGFQWHLHLGGQRGGYRPAYRYRAQGFRSASGQFGSAAYCHAGPSQRRAGPVSGTPGPRLTGYRSCTLARQDQARASQALAHRRTGARGEDEQAYL